jgi:hypothetical protein
VARVSGPLLDVVDEGRRVLAAADREGATLRLLGGVAVFLRAPNGLPEPFRRTYHDLDFAAPRGSSKACSALFQELGYDPDVPFNSLHGAERLLFLDRSNGRKVDVFVGEFRMSHRVPLEGRLALDPLTVPLAELLLTKLQIAELNEKDVRDSLALLHGHVVTGADGDSVNGARVAEVLGDDWGLWRTFTGNLAVCRERLAGYSLGEPEPGTVAERIDALTARIDAEPKTRAWKLRARIGERKRWYETPEEVGGD